MICFPCAKINLGLQVTSKRNDGFHNIETVFIPIAFNDVLEIVPSENGKFSFSTYGLKISCDNNDNLCVKAWNLYNNIYKLSPVEIYLYKTIPSGAGLGGGSSNAAFALKSLNEFYHLNISDATLKKYADNLGSDCPFFIHPEIILARGKGEIFEHIDLNISKFKLIVIIPDIQINTSLAYSLVKPDANRKSLKKILSEISIKEWKHFVVNDFETALKDLFPYIAEYKKFLYDNGAVYSSLSGSGSAVYGIFESDIPSDIFKFFNNCIIWTGKL